MGGGGLRDKVDGAAQQGLANRQKIGAGANDNARGSNHNGPAPAASGRASTGPAGVAALRAISSSARSTLEIGTCERLAGYFDVTCPLRRNPPGPPAVAQEHTSIRLGGN